MALFRKKAVAVMALVAFLVAALGPLFPGHAAAAAQPCAMMMDMAGHHDGTSKPMSMPGCGGDMGCIVMCALPATAEPASATTVIWSDVGYWTAIRPLTGVTISPDPSPPRSRA